MTAEAITNAALALPPQTRAELADTLLRSLDPAEQEIQKAWAAEAEARISAYDRGETKSLSRQEVMEGLKPDVQL